MDELMSDPAQPFTAPQTQEGESSGKPAAWNTKKFREEFDITKSRLTDQSFDISQYPDPLIPRDTNSSQNTSKAQKFNAETEQRLLALIARIKAKG